MKNFYWVALFIACILLLLAYLRGDIRGMLLDLGTIIMFTFSILNKDD